MVEYNNPADIIIGGVEIRYHTEITISNITTIIPNELTTGKSELLSYGDSSRVVTFKSYIPNNEQQKEILVQYENLRQKSLAALVPCIIGDLNFNGKITSLGIVNDKLHGVYELDWEVTEGVSVSYNKVTLPSMNYSVPSTTVKTVSLNSLPTYYKHLIKVINGTCNKKVQVVTYLQKYLKSIGYYTGVVDGLLCTKTVAAIKKWQKKFKVSVTGKWDKKTVAKFKAHFGIATGTRKKEGSNFG